MSDSNARYWADRPLQEKIEQALGLGGCHDVATDIAKVLPSGILDGYADANVDNNVVTLTMYSGEKFRIIVEPTT